MVQKLSLSKYLEHMQEPEFIEVSEMYDEDKEIKTEEVSDPLSIKDYDDIDTNTAKVDILKQNSVDNDCETKIEIVEELALKTESSDLSELNQ